MKKIFTALFIISSLIFFSCKSESKDPKDVLISFFEALSTKDIKKARTYATAESKEMLDMLEMSAKKDTTNDPNDKFNKENLEFGEVVINGDKATVPVKEKGSGATVKYILKNENGWKVAFDKASMMQIGTDAASESGMNTDSLENEIKSNTDINLDSVKNEINQKLQGLDTVSSYKGE